MSHDEINQGRRRVLTTLTSVAGAAGAVGVAVPFVGSWNPSAKAKAAGAPVEVNVAKIEPGAMITVEWRGKPVYIVRRTKEALLNLQTMESKLGDPRSEKADQPTYVEGAGRTIPGKEEFAILLGLCTHLGCAPGFEPEVGSIDIGDIEWQGGFFCKCHGSTFDLSGRVLKGVPAPVNLIVPPHKYVSDTVIIIGEDQEA